MFYRRVMMYVLMTSIMCASWLAVVAAPASAATACDGEILDNAPLFSGWISSAGDTASSTQALRDVEAAVVSLKTVGATVKVVTSERSYGSGLGITELLMASCSKWFDSDGKLLSDYIIFVAVVDSANAEIEYGSAWEGKLGATGGTNVTEASKIARKFMVHSFFEWKYSEGFVDAINETRQRIAGPAITAAPIASDDSSVSERPGPEVWLIPVGIVTFITLAALAVWWWQRRKEGIEAKKAAIETP